MRLTVTGFYNDIHTLELQDHPPESLRFHLGAHEESKKDGEAVIPAVFRPCESEACRGKGKPCSGGPHRLSANVTHMTALVADLDSLGPDDFPSLLASLGSVQAFWWHTYSYQPHAPCARLLIPFAEELPLSSPLVWSRRYWPQLMAHFGLTQDADSACKDPARIYYLPRKYPGGLHSAGEIQGPLFDWRPVLGDLSRQAPPEDASVLPAALPEEDDSRPVDLGEVRARLEAVGVEPVATLLGRVLKGRPPVAPPASRPPGELSRYEAWRALTNQVAICAEGWMSSTALSELLRPSWAAEVQESPEDHTPWERVLQLLHSARRSAEIYKAQKNAALEGMRRAQLRRSASRVPASPDVGPPGTEAPTESEEDRAALLESMLERLPSKDPGVLGPLRPSQENVAPILALHPDWAESLRFNRLTQEVEIWGGPLLAAGEDPGRPMREADVGDCRDWFARTLQIRLADHVVAPRMLAVAEEFSYDPLQDYLNSLKWDGMSRIEDFLIRYFGARDRDGRGPIFLEYLREIGSKWLISAVARGLDPGCKVDTILELEGAQGTGKSSALAILGGPWFSDASISLGGDKDSLLLISRAWLVEQAEAASYSRAAVSAQKEFISRQVDRYRPPYARVTKAVPRRCVFATTTNEDQYLADPTGNRRHWPVSTGAIDLAALRTDRDQIWAEAVALYRSGASWTLSEKVRSEAAIQASDRLPDNLLAQGLLRTLLDMSPERRPSELSTHDACRLLEIEISRAQEVRLGHALRALGCVLDRRAFGGIRQRVYVLPEAITQAPRATNAPMSQRIAQARPMHIVKD